MGEAIERVTAQHAHRDIEDLFSGRGGLPAAEWGFVSRWLHGSKLL